MQRRRKMNRASGKCDTVQCTTVYIMGVPDGDVTGEIFKDILAANNPNWLKNIYIHIREVC